MNDVKSILASRTVWANIVGLASVSLSLAGIDLGEADANRLVEAATQIVAAMSFIGSTVFRIAASQRLAG
jgi:uncharacterized membrane protein YqjE